MKEKTSVCVSIILAIEIRINSIPFPTAQQTPKQIPKTIDERTIKGTYPNPTFVSC